MNSPEFNIRHAERRDARGIAKVHVDVWRSSYRGIIPDFVLEELSYEKRASKWNEILMGKSGESANFVAVAGEEIIGFASAGALRDEENQGHDGELYALYLLSSFQGEGIGKALFLRCAQWLREQGRRSMLAWVLTENPSVGFYEAMGGKRLGSKGVEIGEMLEEVSYGWELESLLRRYTV